MGRLKPYSDGKEGRPADLATGQALPFAGWECIRPLLDVGHAQGLQRSFARELQGWRNGAVTYAIVIDQPQPEGSGFDLVELALLRVSPRAIPLDSSYEATAEDALVAQDRSFDKPMRYVDGDDTLPNFRLLDAGEHPVPMEVFGRNDPDY